MSPIVIRLQQLRKKAGLSQEALAEATGARQATISNLERGVTTRIEFELLDRLSDVLSTKLGRAIGPGKLLQRAPASKRSRPKGR